MSSNIIRGKSDSESLPQDLLSKNYHKWAILAGVGFVFFQTLLLLNFFDSKRARSTYPFSDNARDINIFMCGAFVVCCVLQITRLAVTVSSAGPWNNKASLFMSFVENFIAAFSTLTTLTGNWGGVCVDAYGIRTAAETWPEWLVSVPTLTFILISMDTKSDYEPDDYAILFFNFNCILWGALMTVHKSLWWNQFCLLISTSTWIVAMYYILKTVGKLKSVLKESSPASDEIGLVKYKKLLAARRITLSYFLVSAESIFTALYFLCWLGIISDDTLFWGLIVASASAKIIFAALATDAHMEMSHPSISQLAEEKKSHAARRAFLRYVFHEVRVPLNSISMGVQLLGESDIDPESPEGEVIAMMREATTFMGETLNDVLAIQKIEEGALQLIFKPFIIENFVSISMESFLLLAKDKGVKLITDIDPNIPACVEGDKYRLKHVLSYLISNAVKFTRQGTRVTVAVRAGAPYSVESATAGKLVTVRKYFISVTDQGPGLAPDDVRNIFTPFLVTKPGELQQGRGTGVGLAICKEIASKHGGTITCESLVGAGSTFTIELPMAVCDDKALSVYSAISTDLADKMAELQIKPALGEAPTGRHAVVFDESIEKEKSAEKLPSTAAATTTTATPGAASSEAGQSTPTQPSPSGAEPPSSEIKADEAAAGGAVVATLPPSSATTAGDVIESASAARKAVVRTGSQYGFGVLVTDDVASNRKLLVLLLKKKGIEPKQAEDGSQAVELVKSLPANSFDCIFMDNTMPVMTGIEATRALRKIGYENMIIGLTGNSMEEELVEFATMGADLVLTKALDLLLEYFTANGVKSKDHERQGLFMDKEKLMWVPKRKRSVSGSFRRKEKDLVLIGDD